MPRNNVFKLFRYHWLGKETDHPSLLHLKLALFFSRYWGGRQGDLNLSPNFDKCRVSCELLFKDSRIQQSLNPGLDGHPVWCEPCVTPTTHI